MIRLTIPSIEDDDLAAVAKVLRSGMLVQGRNVAELEGEIAEFLRVEHVVAVSSGTAALHLALLSGGVGPGDIVLVPTYSWVATANVVELVGARPVFVDIDPLSFNLSPDALERTLARLDDDPVTAGRVRAVLPVHAFGLAARMDRISAVAAERDLLVIEDAACALGAGCGDRYAGTIGQIGCFSLHPRKAITTGEGGLCATHDPAVAHRLRVLRNHGIDPDVSPAEFVEPGYNYRLTDFQAALGRCQLNKLPRVVNARREAARRYDSRLAETDITPPAGRDEGHIFQSYVVLLPPRAASRRDAIIAALRQRGVETTVGTIHIPMTKFYREAYAYRTGDFPATDDVAARALTLPLHEKLSASDQDHVIASLRDVIEETAD